ncbi:MAG TPA: hypothetical protein VFT23_00960 [Burkholderiales bacterium]|nr:hypothetical protein [Burkholderiales bacterium]
MSSDQIQCEVLKRAAEIAGGEDELAKRLNVKPEDMQEWLKGKATAPAGIYIIALDILVRSAAASSTGRGLTFDSKFTGASHGFTARKAKKKKPRR